MLYRTCWKAQKVHRISSKKKKTKKEEKKNTKIEFFYPKNLKLSWQQFKALTTQIDPRDHQVWQEITSRKDLFKSKQ